MPAVEKVEASVLPTGYTMPPSLGGANPVRESRFDLGVPLEMPSKLSYGAMADRRLRLFKAISLDLYRDGELVVAWAPELEEFGSGSNITEALEDFGKTIAEEYLSLQEQEADLGYDLRNHFHRLREYISLRR
jgi:hypothetical protein